MAIAENIQKIKTSPFHKELNRTHYAGVLRKEDTGKTVTLMGWVSVLRDHGGVRFVDLRDHTGITQVVFSPEKNIENHQVSHRLRSEDVVAVTGKVLERPADTANPNMPTGDVEVWCDNIYVLNHADPIPFQIEDDISVNEDTRLRYRHLDLRRNVMQDNIRKRHLLINSIRNFLTRKGFVDIETPMLTRSTPEGARDYLVPSRIYPGSFFALPQSPQLFKQMLMISGFDRYYQVVKCFRDEDLRADRQPEFTQLDMEMAFIHEQGIIDICEELFCGLFKLMGVTVPARPFPAITYNDAMSQYGNDRPDTRFDMKLFECTDIMGESSFRVFRQVCESGGKVIGMPVPGGGKYSRKEIDDLIGTAVLLGAGGLAYFKVTTEGKLKSNIDKYFEPELLERIYKESGASPDDLLTFVADEPKKAYQVISSLRLEIARDKNIVDKNKQSLTWVTDFPLFEYDAQEKRYVSIHHPFTSPHPDDMELLETNPGKVRSRGYDLVWNGTEIGGGSIRIHQPDVQEKIFRVLGISGQEAEEKFGFLLKALRSGAPPHGGIAFGLDRICMQFFNVPSIRDVIAFPKTQKAQCLLTEAPAAVDDKQLKELSLKTITPQ